MKTKKLLKIVILSVLFGIIINFKTLAQQGVSINTTGTPADNSAILDVSDTSRGILIPRMTDTQKMAIVSPANGLLIYQTDTVIGFWYYDATIPAWIQPIGTIGPTGPAGAAGPTGATGVTGATGSANSTGLHFIGECYNGGKIFYLDSTEANGLICTTTDQSTSAAWATGCTGATASVGASATAIGTGQANTNAILAGCSTAGIAARLCDNLVLAGYSDWYLPSKDELNQMYVQREISSGFAGDFYWSSSEIPLNWAWFQNFSDGSQVGTNKIDALYVRCVRTF